MPNRYYWVTPGGSQIDLQSSPYLILQGMSGHLMPPFARSEKWLGELGVLTGLRPDARDVFLPLLVRAADIDAAMRQIATIFNPRNGDGYLRAVDGSGQARRLMCRYAGGLEGGESGAGWYRVGVRLRALQPYWEAESAAQYTYTVDQPVLFFSYPFGVLSDSTINVGPTLVNGGDVPVYPIITITGRTRNAILKHLDTGRQVYFPSLAMESGDILTIDMRRENMSVMLNNNNAYALMDLSSMFWSLAPGQNTLLLIADGSETNSSIKIEWYERYLTA